MAALFSALILALAAEAQVVETPLPVPAARFAGARAAPEVFRATALRPVFRARTAFPLAKARPGKPVFLLRAGALEERLRSPRPAQGVLRRFFDGAGKEAWAIPAVPVAEDLAVKSCPLLERWLLPRPGGLGRKGLFADVPPGGIFDWNPIEKSPGHGFPPLDWLIRKTLGLKDRRFSEGFDLTNAEDPSRVRVFLYGEKHTSRAVIRENMSRLAESLRSGGGGLVLVEAYFGPSLRGSQALGYLRDAGMTERDSSSLKGLRLEVRTWDDPEAWAHANHIQLQLHMEVYGLNRLAFGEERGLGYYLRFARAAAEAFRDWRRLREAAIETRNLSLDKALAKALAEAGPAGLSVHVIAGTEHLAQAAPLGRARLRRGLLEALGGRTYWARRPAD